MDSPTAALVDDRIKAPRYMQVYSALYQWIAQGNYAPGSQLEAESELCDIFGVSRITVRKAIDMLVTEGMLRRVQGKGTFVPDDYVSTAVRSDLQQRIRTARRMARNSLIRDLQIGSMEASYAVANDLRLDTGTDVQHVSYVRVLDGEPVGFVEGWFPARLPVKLSAAAFRKSTLLTILEDQGIALDGVDHLIGATLAGAEMATKLGINVGAPLVRLKLVMLDSSQDAVESVRGFFRADRYEHHMYMTTLSQQSPHESAKKGTGEST